MNKYILAFQLSFQDLLEYRLDLTLALIKYAGMVILMSFVWTAAAQSSPNFALTQQEIVTYFIFAAGIYSLSNFHTNYIEEDIRLGGLSKYLLKPISALKFYEMHQLAEATIVTLLKMAIFIPLVHFFILPLSLSLLEVLIFLLFLPIIFLFSFYFFSLISLGAFWIQEVYAIRWSLTVLMRFLAGTFVPLIFFPEWFQRISQFLPFQYLVYTPVQLLSHKVEVMMAVQGLMILGAWTAAVFVIRRSVWRSGSRQYEGTGI